MNTIYLTENDIKNLMPDQAVDFFRRLLWVEADYVGVTKNLIEAPMDIFTPDGGLDAFINDANPISEEVIPKGNSGFQIRTGKSTFKISKKDFHEKQNVNRPLKKGIKYLLDNNGTYIFVDSIFLNRIYKI